MRTYVTQNGDGGLVLGDRCTVATVLVAQRRDLQLVLLDVRLQRLEPTRGVTSQNKRHATKQVSKYSRPCTI